MKLIRTGLTWPKINRKQWVKDRIESESTWIREAPIRLKEEPMTLSSLSEAARKIANYHWIFSKDKTKFVDHLQLAHLARTWHYRAMLNDGPHTICLPGIPCFTTGKVQTNIDVTMESWIMGLDMSIIFRDQLAIEQYSQMPFEPFKRMGMEMESWNKFDVEFRRWVCLRESSNPELYEIWQKYHELTRTHLFEKEIRKVIMQTWIQPEVKLWGHLIHDEKDQFSESLKEALKGWAKYHRIDDHRSNLVGVYIPTHLNAIAALAYDRGFPIKVKSDYLLEFLWRGDFEKVKWTPK